MARPIMALGLPQTVKRNPHLHACTLSRYRVLLTSRSISILRRHFGQFTSEFLDHTLSKTRLAITPLEDFENAGSVRIQPRVRNIRPGHPDDLRLLLLCGGKSRIFSEIDPRITVLHLRIFP